MKLKNQIDKIKMLRDSQRIKEIKYLASKQLKCIFSNSVTFFMHR